MGLSSIRLVLVAASLSVVVPSLASGQETARQGPVRVPPALVHFEPRILDASVFPDGEEVLVVLELEVDVDGSVRAARVVEGAAEPFDGAALEAAAGFQFTPATRDGEPVAARIRFRYVFTPPAPEPELPSPEAPSPEAPSPAAPSPAAPSPAAPSPEPELDELAPAPDTEAPDEELQQFRARAVVRAPAREPQRHEIERREVRRIAGAHGDAIRALELLPGASTPPGGAALIVRGSSPLDTQVMLEGAPVLSLNHVGGYTSFFNAQLLDRVDLYPSNFSVRYGRALGAVVDVHVRDVFADGVHGGVQLDIIDAWGYVEGGSPQVSGAVAARRSWIDAIYGAVLGDDHTVTAPVYYDYQGILRYAPSRDDAFRLLTYGSYDDLALHYDEPGRDPAIQGELSNRTQFHQGQLEWRHRYSADVRHELSVMVGYLEYDQQILQLLSASDEGVVLGSRGEVIASVDPRVRLTFGYDLWAHNFAVRYVGPPAPAPEGDPAGFAFSDERRVTAAEDGWVARSAFYAEAQISPIDEWTLVPGVRVDYLGDIEAWTFEPRLATQVRVTDTTLLRGGVGLFAQPPQLGRAIAGFGNPDLEPERAVHTTLGVQQEVESSVRIGLDGYFKYFFDRIVSTPDGSAPFLINDGEGRAYGAELSARWIGDERLTGYLSYALSRSERRDRDGSWRRFDYDQTHALTVALSYDFGDGWEAGATFRLLSGTPLTPVIGALYDANADRYVPRYGEVNSGSNPLWYRLDLRLSKTFVIEGTGRIQIAIDVMNATNTPAQGGLSYAYDYRESLASYGLPIVPNLSLRGEL